MLHASDGMVQEVSIRCSSLQALLTTSKNNLEQCKAAVGFWSILLAFILPGLLMVPRQSQTVDRPQQSWADNWLWCVSGPPPRLAEPSACLNPTAASKRCSSVQKKFLVASFDLIGPLGLPQPLLVGSSRCLMFAHRG